MAFKLDDIIVDRIQMAVAESTGTTPELLYTLTQLKDASIEISAESKDATDATGTLVKRFWQGKTGTFTATNAMLNLNVIGAASGSGVDNTVTSVPKIVVVKGDAVSAVISGYAEGTVQVYALGNNGTLGTKYTLATNASTTQFSINDSNATLTLPTPSTLPDKFIIKYDRTITAGDGIVLRNKADKFPDTVKLTMKALVVDPCDAGTLRAAYIVLPSFQVSPEVSINFDTEGNLDYKGDLQVDYCGGDKVLYEIYMVEDDEENED